MPRAGWVKPVSPRRLSDLVSVGLLTRVFPPGVVDEVIAECGRTEQRHRSLPARTMAYFAVGMALHSEGSYEDVMGLMTDGLAWSDPGVEPIRLPSKSAIFQARERLGSAPVRALFERVARPLASHVSAESFLAGRRLVAIDGTMLDVADTVANDEFFGRPGTAKGERSAFPQVRLVALAECGTHAIFEAELGTHAESEMALSKVLVERLEAGMVLLADRGYCSFDLWQQASATGADLLWRAKNNTKPRRIETLADGSWLAELRRNNAKLDTEHVVVRVVDYDVDDGRNVEAGPFRLFTTLLDPTEVSATELAAAYAQRWEIESAFDELKTHQRGARTVLRSKSPELVKQEIWGHLCCHYAIRTLMFAAAHEADVDPDRVSFVAALRISRRSLSPARDFSPSELS
ncbi:MAG: IS4 family transposase [Acidimicrobiaceae bacterium]|nr:IS4 family transposase [Acidimicrobiaceae bacterium]